MTLESIGSRALCVLAGLGRAQPFFLGFCIVLPTWLALRNAVGAGLRAPALALLLDFGVVLVGWCVVLLFCARPILAALAIAALAIGLAVVDRVKRQVLREPVLFADRAELLELVRHPQLYLPFAGTFAVLAGVSAAIGAVAAMIFLEPAAFTWSPVFLVLAPAIFCAFLVVPTWPPLLQAIAGLYRTWQPTGDPDRDNRRFGVLAGFVVHATLARAERPARQAALRPASAPIVLAAQTIVLVQSESFFDAGRLAPDLAAAVLPNWHELCGGSVCHGALAVPCWGANTIRSEFAVLAGVGEDELGLDRFNPYASLARAPIASLAWQAREAGFRTICVHPFDLGFYGRRQVLPMLGFQELIGPEAFAGAKRAGRYVSDDALAGKIADILARESGRVLVFGISMACHGPWDGPADPATSLPVPPSLAGPEAGSLSQFLFRLRESDAALPLLPAALRARGGLGVLAVYGDHQPSLPASFAAAGMGSSDTDYLIWRSDGARGPRRDLSADRLGHAVLEAAT